MVTPRNGLTAFATQFTCIILICLLVSSSYSDPRIPRDYSAVDRRALAAPPEAEKSVKSLARYLCSGLDDFSRARAIYRWMTDRFDYYDDLSDRVIYDPEIPLHTRKGVCHEFAILYQALAQEGGLECEYVAGWTISKGKVIAEHAWNKVKVGGRWLPLDASWGWGYDVENQPHKQFDSYWFLPEPEVFAQTHRPDLRQNEMALIRQFRKSRELVRLGEVKERHGDLRGALHEYNSADSYFRGSGILNRARVELKLGDLRDANDDSDRVLRANADSAEAYLIKAQVQERLGSLPEALKLYQAALLRNPQLLEAKSARKRVKAALLTHN